MKKILVLTALLNVLPSVSYGMEEFMEEVIVESIGSTSQQHKATAFSIECACEDSKISITTPKGKKKSYDVTDTLVLITLKKELEQKGYSFTLNTKEAMRWSKTKTGTLMGKKLSSDKWKVCAIRLEGTELVVGISRGIDRSNMRTSRALETIKERISPHTIIKVDFLEYGTSLVTLASNGLVSLWQTDYGTLYETKVASDKGECDVQFIGITTSVNSASSHVTIVTPSNLEMYTVIDPSLLESIKRKLNPAVITKKSLSPNEKTIATLDSTGSVSLWKSESGKEIERSLVVGKENIESIGFNDTSTQIIITTSDGKESYDIIDSKTLKYIKIMLGNATIVKRRVSLDGSKIAIIDSMHRISVWDTSCGYCNHLGESLELAVMNDSISLEVNNKGTQVTITTPEGTKFYDIINSAILRGIKTALGHDAVIIKIAISPNESKIAILDSMHRITVWNRFYNIVGQCLESVEVADVQSIKVNDTGSQVVSSAQEAIKLYDIIKYNVAKAIQEELGNAVILKKSISPDESKIAILVTLNRVSVWDILSSILIGQSLDSVLPQKIQSIEFNDESSQVTIVDTEGLKVCNLIRPDLIKAIKKGLDDDALVTKISISPDGFKVTILDTNNRVLIWDADSNALLKTITLFSKDIHSIKFNNECTQVVVATSENTEYFAIAEPNAH